MYFLCRNAVYLETAIHPVSGISETLAVFNSDTLAISSGHHLYLLCCYSLVSSMSAVVLYKALYVSVLQYHQTNISIRRRLCLLSIIYCSVLVIMSGPVLCTCVCVFVCVDDRSKVLLCSALKWAKVLSHYRLTQEVSLSTEIAEMKSSSLCHNIIVLASGIAAEQQGAAPEAVLKGHFKNVLTWRGTFRPGDSCTPALPSL